MMSMHACSFVHRSRHALRATCIGLLAVAMAGAVVAGCVSAAPDRAAASTPPSRSKPLNVRLEAGKSAEECVTLEAAAQIAWRFESSATVDFNIHYHRGRDVVSPVERPRTQGDSGTLSAPVAESYCLMWTNTGGIPAFVSGELKQPLR